VIGCALCATAGQSGGQAGGGAALARPFELVWHAHGTRVSPDCRQSGLALPVMF